MMRDRQSAILNEHGGFEVVATVADGREAVNQAIRAKPDVALIGIAMPEMNGIEATELIRDACPSIRIVNVSMYSSIDYVYRALRAGADGMGRQARRHSSFQTQRRWPTLSESLGLRRQGVSSGHTGGPSCSTDLTLPRALLQ
jgi:chemotaxis response regulator CheB